MELVSLNMRIPKTELARLNEHMTTEPILNRVQVVRIAIRQYIEREESQRELESKKSQTANN